MDQHGLFDRVLESLHRAAFDASVWPETAGRIEVACSVKGSALVFAGGQSPQGVEINFTRFCFRGQRREDFEQLYLNDYWPRDERIPRLRRLPDGQLVHNHDLYGEAERKTSATYNEVQRHTESQDSLYVRLDGPGGTRLLWALGDPVNADAWGSDQTRMMQRIVPHVRQFARVRHALLDARALGNSLSGLLDVTGTGVIHLDRTGRILAANDSAVELLRQADGLLDKGGVLQALAPSEDAELQILLERAMPHSSGHGAAGSMTVGGASAAPRYVLHVSPVGKWSQDFDPARLAAVMLILDPARRPRIDADLVAAALGLTPTEGAVAGMLATGFSLSEIAVAMCRKESTIRTHLKRIFAKLRVSRQADLVRLVLSVSSVQLSRR